MTRYWPKLAEARIHPSLEHAIRLAYDGIYDVQDALMSMSSQAVLHPTLSSAGVITRVDIIRAGKYDTLPAIRAIGGGGSGSVFATTLNNSGGIASVTVINGGSGYTSLPYIKVG
jgi:hypothetical protein